jgi:hypothetical protein
MEYVSFLNNLDLNYPKWEKDPRKILFNIVISGNLDRLKLVISHLPPNALIDYRSLGSEAAKKGYFHIVEWLVKTQKVDNQTIIVMAADSAEKGYVDIVQWLIYKGEINSFNYIAEKAARGGHFDILQWIINAYHPTNFDDMAEGASSNGYFYIVRWLVDTKGAKNFNLMARYAANSGYLNIVLWVLDKGANNYQEIIQYADLGNHPEISKHIKDIYL